jgi:hypothetical protein
MGEHYQIRLAGLFGSQSEIERIRIHETTYTAENTTEAIERV